MTNGAYIIGIEKCSCGMKSCSTYWLTGIGKFCQGSGFDKDEAERIIAALNPASIIETRLAFTCERTGKRWEFKNTSQLIEAFLDATQPMGPVLVSGQPERCKHGVWAADRCEECVQQPVGLSRKEFGEKMAVLMLDTMPPVGKYELTVEQLRRYIDCAYSVYSELPKREVEQSVHIWEEYGLLTIQLPERGLMVNICADNSVSYSDKSNGYYANSGKEATKRESIELAELKGEIEHYKKWVENLQYALELCKAEGNAHINIYEKRLPEFKAAALEYTRREMARITGALSEIEGGDSNG